MKNFYYMIIGMLISVMLIGTLVCCASSFNEKVSDEVLELQDSITWIMETKKEDAE